MSEHEGEVVCDRQSTGRDLYCPFEPHLNPHIGKVQRWSLAWARRFSLLCDETEYHKLAQAKLASVVGRTFCEAPVEALQLAADWLTWLCILDDRVEDEASSPLELSAMLFELLEVFRSGDPGGTREDGMVSALLDLRRRMLDQAPLDWVGEFADLLQEEFTAFSWETINRAQGLQPSLSSYCAMREITIGLLPWFHLTLLTDGIRLPRDLHDHPSLQRLRTSAIRAIAWQNDLFTYEKEHATGQTHNLVLVLMASEQLGVDEAVRSTIDLHNSEVKAFEEAQASLPSFGPWDSQVRRYVTVLRAAIRGHLDWTSETLRYQPGSELNGYFTESVEPEDLHVSEPLSRVDLGRVSPQASSSVASA